MDLVQISKTGTKEDFKKGMEAHLQPHFDDSSKFYSHISIKKPVEAFLLLLTIAFIKNIYKKFGYIKNTLHI